MVVVGLDAFFTGWGNRPRFLGGGDAQEETFAPPTRRGWIPVTSTGMREVGEPRQLLQRLIPGFLFVKVIRN